ncbi:hypothetical protein AB0387_20290 [Streptomyces sp. NPDC089173]|uniref:hypothetical protein n=1 Tax=Streptomyces sp. NPDC089173 TaxID=3154965 RepID=UPI0034505D91
MSVGAKNRLGGGEPVAEVVFTGVNIDTTGSPNRSLDLSGRWLDWEERTVALA